MDTSILISEVEEGIAAADTSVTIEEPDASAITDAIEGAISDVDTGALDDIGAAASGAGQGLQDLGSGGAAAAGGLETAGSSATIASGAVAVAARSTEDLRTKVDALAKRFGPAAFAIGIGAGAVTKLFGAASDADQALGRFDSSLGDTADSVRQIDIGGLNADLSDLAVQTGSVDEGLFRAAAGIADLGRSSGASQAAIATTAEQILALSLRSAALRPELGTADEVIGSLTRGLARGGRTVQAFGIDLSAAEIKARALADTGKATAAELSQFELAAAGAAIASERLGTQLGEDVAQGSATALVQARSLSAGFNELVETLGGLIEQPVAEFISDISRVIGVATDAVGFLNQDFGEMGLILPGINTNFRAARSGFGELIREFVTGEPNLQRQTEILAQMPGATGEAARAALEHQAALREQNVAVQESTEAFGIFFENFGEGAPMVAEAITTIVDSFATNLPVASAVLGQFTDDIIANVDEGILAFEKMVQAQQAFFPNLNAIIAQGGQDLALSILQLGPIEGAAFAQAIANATPQQIAALEVAIDAQNQFLGGAQGQAGTAAGQAFIAGADSTDPAVRAAFAALAAGGVDATKEQKGGAEGAGRELGYSVAAGLEGSRPNVIERVRRWGVSVRRSLEDIFEFGSPSKVGLRIGAGLASSIALGIESEIPRVETAIARIRPALVVGPGMAGGNSVTNNNSFVLNDRTGDPWVTAQEVSREIARQAS